MARRFVMLDRDRTVIKECHYLADLGQISTLEHYVTDEGVSTAGCWA